MSQKHLEKTNRTAFVIAMTILILTELYIIATKVTGTKFVTERIAAIIVHIVLIIISIIAYKIFGKKDNYKHVILPIIAVSYFATLFSLHNVVAMAISAAIAAMVGVFGDKKVTLR